MIKMFRRFVALCLACALLFWGSLCFEVSATVDYEQSALTAINSEQDALEERIQLLYDQRRELMSQDIPDMMAICEIETQMHELGVDFLSYEQVTSQFPDVKYENAAISASLDNAMPNATVPGSSVNSWSTYRVSNYYYEGQYFNIQKLVAEPIHESSSSLWEEGERRVYFSTDWVVVATNLLTVAAEALAGVVLEDYAWVLSLADAIKGLAEGAATITEMRVSDVTYSYETKTTAVFAYTKIEGQPDSTQILTHISTKCYTQLSYIMDIERWSLNGAGDMVAEPGMRSGECTFNNIPTNYSSSGWAVYMYLYEPTLVRHDTVDSITLTAPENRIIGTIYPCKPQFPAHCE